MYQVIDGEPVEVVRHGEEILPADHWKVSQIIGQMVLFDVNQYSSNPAE
jgi:hypothetical protein